MKQIFLSIAILLAGITANQAQNTFPSTGAVGIGTTSPNATSLLEINSVTKGFLTPRMTRVQRLAIVTPALGLLVYQTDSNAGFYYYYGAGWNRLLTTAANTSLSNLSSTVAINQSLLPGTTSTIDLGSSTKQWKNAYLSGGLTVTSISGIGVNSYGSSDGVYASSGSGYGVYASSNTGYGIYATNTAGSYGVVASGGYGGSYGSGDTYGVYGTGNTYGVYGTGTTYGVYGTGSIGLFATSIATNGDGVHSTVSGATNYGVNSYSANSYGIYAGTGSSSSYAGYFGGNIYCTGAYLPSDTKLKKNIASVENAMDILNRLQPRNYEYRSDGNFAKMNLPTGQHYGFIVQDLEKILPNLVKETSFDVAKTIQQAQPPATVKGTPPTQPLPAIKEIKEEKIDFKAINYIELIPIMVKGMQEQAAEIANLKSEINELKAMIVNKGSSNSVGSYLKQNIPNPSNNSTTIAYAVPGNTSRSEIRITDAKGSSIKTYSVRGAGQLTIQSGELPVGVYNYSLYANNKVIETKQMVVVK